MTTAAIVSCVLLGLVSFALVPAAGSVRRSGCALVLLSLCVLLVQTLAGIDVFVATLPGAGGDAHVFLERAMGLLRHPARVPALSVGADAYLQYLWGFGRVFTADAMVLHYAAIVPACLSLALIATIVSRVDGRAPALCATALLLALSPGLLLYSSVTVRESLELASLTAYLACVLGRRGPGRALLAAPALIPGMLVQPVLFVYAFLLVAGTCLVTAACGRGPRVSAGRIAISLGAAGLALTVAAMYVPLWYGKTAAGILGEGLAPLLIQYRQPIEAASPATAFGIKLSFDSAGAAAGSILENYVYYLFAPLLDFRPELAYVIMAWESLIRLAGLCAAMVLIRARAMSLPLAILACFYVTLTAAWSLGTTNSGQAFRHHVLTQWVVCVLIGCAVAVLWDRWRRHEAPVTGSR